MKSKRRILEEAVLRMAITAAHKFDTVTAFGATDADADLMAQVADDETAALRDLSLAVEEYETHLLTIDGRGARWAEGSATSREAARLAWPLQSSCRQAIIALMANVGALAAPGYTDRQLEQRLSRSHQTVSSARNWLVEAGWLEDSGIRRTTNGRPATVWQLTARGRAALTERTST